MHWVRTAIFAGVLTASVRVLAACSGSSDPGSSADSPHGPDDPEGAVDSGAAPTQPDAGAARDAPSADAGAYAAFKPDIGRLVNIGGPVLSAPKIVTVVWTSDPNYKTYEKLSDAIGASAFWKTAMTEYGVGPATGGGHVEIRTPPPDTLDDAPGNDEIDAFVRAGVSGAPGNGWPVPDAQTLYLVYVPESTTIQYNGQDDCSAIGYHTETSVGALSHVVYGIVAEGCHGSDSVVEIATETAVHEIAEAASDPHTNTDLAWAGFDADHYAWELFQQRQDENGDACEFYKDSYYVDPELGVYVQRLWSNAAAAAGRDPCVPAPAHAYFNVTPLAQEKITPTSSTGRSRTTKGFHAPLGASKSFDIGFYSDAPTDDWTVEAIEGDGSKAPSVKHLQLSVDNPSGNNGAKAKVTFKVTSLPSKGNQILVTLVSTGATGKHYFPVLIGAY
jgi:hypothetical protein